MAFNRPSTNVNFGLGALEDMEDTMDIYGEESKDQFDFELGEEKTVTKQKDVLA